MDLHDNRNVRRVFRTMAAQWGCPVWMVERIIQQAIDRNWEKAMADPEVSALWGEYLPNGKPTPTEYILRLGHAHERGEDVPYLFLE